MFMLQQRTHLPSFKSTEGGPAIASLERKYGHTWRKGNEMLGRAISDRKKIVGSIEGLLKKGCSLNEALDYLDEMKGTNSFSSLCKMLRN